MKSRAECPEAATVAQVPMTPLEAGPRLPQVKKWGGLVPSLLCHWPWALSHSVRWLGCLQGLSRWAGGCWPSAGPGTLGQEHG